MNTMTPHDLLAWLRTHPAEAYLALSVALNLLVRLRVLQRLEATRAGGAVLGLVRSLGIDPVGALQVLAGLAGAKAASSSDTARALLSSAPTSLPPAALPAADEAPLPTPRTDRRPP